MNHHSRCRRRELRRHKDTVALVLSWSSSWRAGAEEGLEPWRYPMERTAWPAARGAGSRLRSILRGQVAGRPRRCTRPAGRGAWRLAVLRAGAGGEAGGQTLTEAGRPEALPAPYLFVSASARYAGSVRPGSDLV